MEEWVDGPIISLCFNTTPTIQKLKALKIEKSETSICHIGSLSNFQSNRKMSAARERVIQCRAFSARAKSRFGTTWNCNDPILHKRELKQYPITFFRFFFSFTATVFDEVYLSAGLCAKKSRYCIIKVYHQGNLFHLFFCVYLNKRA